MKQSKNNRYLLNNAEIQNDQRECPNGFEPGTGWLQGGNRPQGNNGWGGVWGHGGRHRPQGNNSWGQGNNRPQGGRPNAGQRPEVGWNRPPGECPQWESQATLSTEQEVQGLKGAMATFGQGSISGGSIADLISGEQSITPIANSLSTPLFN